ncbi:excisionase family DNA-binding protein [Paenirhodobacter populi]
MRLRRCAGCSTWTWFACAISRLAAPQRSTRAGTMGKMESILFTPDMLAERWGCSGETIRKMVRSGQIYSFRVGKRSIRIPYTAVEEYENCQNTRSDDCAADSASSGMTQMEDDDATSSMPRQPPKQKLRLDRSFVRHRLREN